ncbi:MAG: hypothetical protein Q8L29_00025 [archaeon]|nr:hypothetical protein [archaeon]
MGYIRSNEDFYMAQGCSSREAEVRVEADKKNVDSGFCNPRKIRDEYEARKEAEEAVKRREHK